MRAFFFIDWPTFQTFPRHAPPSFPLRNPRLRFNWVCLRLPLLLRILSPLFSAPSLVNQVNTLPMISLSPTLAKRAVIALETVARAPLLPIVDRQTPRNLSALPPSIRALPADLQVVELANMLADARDQRNDRNAVVRDLRQQLAFAEQACGRALRRLDAFAQLVRIHDPNLFERIENTLSR